MRTQFASSITVWMRTFAHSLIYTKPQRARGRESARRFRRFVTFSHFWYETQSVCERCIGFNFMYFGRISLRFLSCYWFPSHTHTHTHTHTHPSHDHRQFPLCALCIRHSLFTRRPPQGSHLICLSHTHKHTREREGERARERARERERERGGAPAAACFPVAEFLCAVWNLKLLLTNCGTADRFCFIHCVVSLHSRFLGWTHQLIVSFCAASRQRDHPEHAEVEGLLTSSVLVFLLRSQ